MEEENRFAQAEMNEVVEQQAPDVVHALRLLPRVRPLLDQEIDLIAVCLARDAEQRDTFGDLQRMKGIE